MLETNMFLALAQMAMWSFQAPLGLPPNKGVLFLRFIHLLLFCMKGYFASCLSVNHGLPEEGIGPLGTGVIAVVSHMWALGMQSMLLTAEALPQP